MDQDPLCLFYAAQGGGAGNANLPPSLKTCSYETNYHLVSFMVNKLLLFGDRARLSEVEWRLVSIENKDENVH